MCSSYNSHSYNLANPSDEPGSCQAHCTGRLEADRGVRAGMEDVREAHRARIIRNSLRPHICPVHRSPLRLGRTLRRRWGEVAGARARGRGDRDRRLSSRPDHEETDERIRGHRCIANPMANNETPTTPSHRSKRKRWNARFGSECVTSSRASIRSATTSPANPSNPARNPRARKAGRGCDRLG